MARNQPTYDFLAGGEPVASHPPNRDTFKRSTTTAPTIGARPDASNENLRAQLNTLQYELDAIKQDIVSGKISIAKAK